MRIDETAIRQWADRHDCRSSLPILIRRLIRESVCSLVSMRFPGNEAVDLSGLDGLVECTAATTWVPEGRSVWEMGCNQDPRTKADSDYVKRTADTPLAEQNSSSFVFVTPRRWNNKEDWLAERRQEGGWAFIHAYDAIDLETWLEEAPVASRWLGEKLGIATPSLKTPHEWWKGWATASTPPITMKLVSTRRHNEQETLLKKLRDKEHIVPVQAEDREEAVAFVVATLIEADALDLLDRTLIATSVDARFPPSLNHKIVVVDVEEGEELDFGDRRNLTIVRAYPKGRLDVRESLLLSHVPSEAFRTELEAMGLPRDEAENMARRMGHSVPILRRQLSRDPDVRRPPWARDTASSKRLLPFAMAGSWVEREDIDDGVILQLLGEFHDGDVTRIRDELLRLEDAPIARYGNVNVVVSQLDALFAVGHFIESADLDRFFQLVPELLGDRDPALDLPQDQWWMANLLGHARRYSGALLSGLGDTLCILSVYGAEICGSRLRLDLSERAGQVVRSLMRHADKERWLSIRGHLRALAEASPSVFLDCLEAELRKPEPAVRAIMGTIEGGISGECLRTDLLWALELIAWDPVHFSRVAEIVFDLRRFETEDNWSNSPRSTACSLFLPWLPATALTVADRMAVLRRLSGRFRSTTIDVCLSLLPGGGPSFASRTARPQWRALEVEVPSPTNADVREAAIEASRLLLDLAPFEKMELEQLLEAATRLHWNDLVRLVSAVEGWADGADEDEKASLRHNLRRQDILNAYQQREEAEELVTALRRMEEVLEPQLPTARNRWLFEDHHVEWRALAEDERQGPMPWREREALRLERRRAAVQEITEHGGNDAILPFALSVKHPELVAQVLVPHDAAIETAIRWVGAILREEPSEPANAFLRQVLCNVGWNDLGAVVRGLVEQGMLEGFERRQRFAENLPGRPVGWQVAETLGPEAESAYWNSASIRIWNDTPPEDVQYAVNKLLEVQRPRSAFSAVAFNQDRLTPEGWVRILQAISRGEELEGPFPSSYYLNEVLQRLDDAEEVTDEQIASLELPFVRILCGYGPRNHQRTLALHRELGRDPALFVQLLTWGYHRSDGACEPELDELPEDRRKFLSELAYHTLEGWEEIPSCDARGDISQEEFNAWAEGALRLASEADRKGVAECHLGALLARFARKRSWDDWMPACILDFLNRPENAALREQFKLGVSNARGVTTRGPYDGGEQERRLAGRYRNLAAKYGNSHPRVSVMLTSIAEEYEWDARREDEQAAVGERWHP